MEINNLIITLIVLACLYTLLTLITYNAKREPYLITFTYSFMIIGISYFLLGLQSALPNFFAYVLYNLFNFLSYVFMLSGIRQVFGIKGINKKIITLTSLSVLAIFIFSVVFENYLFRVVVVSLTITYYFIDGILDIKNSDTRMPDSVRRMTLIFLIGSMSIWFIRFIIIVYFGFFRNLSLNNQFQANAFLILSVISVSLWFALTIWLDAKKTMYDLDFKNNELEKLALRDQLTGLSNRHYFDYDIVFLVASSKRNKSPMGMLLIDLDRFKLVNDIHGHDVGDAVLKQTAEIIAHSLRASDRAYRWGGEEFLVVLPDTERDGMIVIAEKITQSFREASFEVIGSITVSIGGAEYETDEDIEHWFKRVDLSLYKAKQTGRDRYNIWVSNEDLPEFFNRIEWRSELESGNKEIDADHQLLVYYANDLHDSIVNRLPIDTIKEVILRMSTHIHAHFRKEEAILFRSGYVDYVEHRSIHQRILQEYEIISVKALNGEISLGALMSFLVEKVVIEHINQEDSKFFSQVN